MNQRSQKTGRGNWDMGMKNNGHEDDDSYSHDCLVGGMAGRRFSLSILNHQIKNKKQKRGFVFHKH